MRVSKFFALFLTMISLSACQTYYRDYHNPRDFEKLKPGTVLQESSTRLGYGYRDVYQAVTNGPDHWEGIGHFGFIYYKDLELCQCSLSQVQISPKGKYAIFNKQDETTKLVLFNVKDRSIRELTDEYEGYPYGAEWNIKELEVAISLGNPDGTGKKSKKFSLVPK